MNQNKDPMHIKLRIPLFILTLCFSIPASKWINMFTSGSWLQQLAYPILIILLTTLFEITKLSEKRVHLVWAAAIVLMGLGIEAMTEPGDYLWMRNMLS